MELNQHTRDGLNFLGLLLGTFALFVYANNQLSLQSNFINWSLFLSSIIAAFVFGIFLIIEIINSFKKKK